MDATPILPQLTAQQAGKEILADELFAMMSTAAGFARDPVTSAGLTWGYIGAVLDMSGTPTKISGDVVTLTASATNYFRLNADGTVSVLSSAPSGWPGPLASGAKAIYEIVVGTDGPSDWTDWRLTFMG